MVTEEELEAFDKVKNLLETEDKENSLLALLLCQQLPDSYHKKWVKILDLLGGAYWQMYGHMYDDPMTFNMFQKMLTQLVRRLFPTFQEANRAYRIADFFGEFLGARAAFNYEPNSQAILAIEQELKEQLASTSVALMLLHQERLPAIKEAITLLENTSWKTLEETDFWLLKIWDNIFHRSIVFAHPSVEERTEWEQLVERLLGCIFNYLEDCSDDLEYEIPIRIRNTIESLWSYASKLGQGKSYCNTPMQQKIATILQLPVFSLRLRQEILLLHELFQFPLTPIDKMRSMSGSLEDNIYQNTLPEYVSQYLQNFRPFLSSLELEHLSLPLWIRYKKAIFDCWSYFYDIALEDYIQSIIALEPEEASSYFYLGQLYFGFKQENEKAKHYFEQYLALAKTEDNSNNFILTEQVYSYRCFNPSPAEALQWIGKIYERNQQYEAAKNIYKNCVQLYPDMVLSPYLHLIQLLLAEDAYSLEALDLLEAYYHLLYTEAVLVNPDETHHTSAADIALSDNAKKWNKQYGYLVASDLDLGRPLGSEYLLPTFRYLFYYFAEFCFYQLQNADKAQRLLSLAKSCPDKLPRYYKTGKKTTLPCYAVSTEEILYLQAEIALEQSRDYWQARSLYNKILKVDPKHKLAQRGLQNIKEMLGY